ncbi:unnamed protein product [Ilex paraguariensis]|uniref:Uncharacterized protein n=1 Tax=Ilex paraguariensis TaxID=185542 RepID=A0ABC8S081_9AQUA
MGFQCMRMLPVGNDMLIVIEIEMEEVPSGFIGAWGQLCVPVRGLDDVVVTKRGGNRAMKTTGLRVITSFSMFNDSVRKLNNTENDSKEKDRPGETMDLPK